MRDVANEAYELVRGMLAALLPSGSIDLTTAMLIQAREIGERGGFEVELTTDGQPQRLDPIVQQQILYLFQEALINVERHACAQRAHIELSWDKDHLTIILTDDGCGFDVDGLQPTGHYGLRIMRERAEGMNGDLTLTSRLGAGSEVMLQVPLASCRERLAER
jgi:two-component system nitrate/nitrite sensor histidine kinase NarX